MSSWKSVVAKLAPTIGTALGGPFGGAAAGMIAKKFLGKEAASEGELEDFIENASPDQLAELKKLDHDFKLKMRELGIKEADLHVQDRKSARQLAQKNMLPHITISVAYSLAYFFTLYAVISGGVDIPQEHLTLATSLISLLTAAQLQILNFWFGSSSGSKEKTDKLAAH